MKKSVSKKSTKRKSPREPLPTVFRHFLSKSFSSKVRNPPPDNPGDDPFPKRVFGRLSGGVQWLTDFPKHVLLELRTLIPCRMACYAELDYTRQRAINVFDPPLGFEPPIEKWMKATHDHPVLNYFKTTGDGQALKISDFLSTSDYHQLDVYREVYRGTGAEDQMGFGVQVAEKFVLGFAFDRGERSFTEKDRTLLNLIRPHIIQAYLHLEELAGHEELQLDLQAALLENGLGVVIVNDQGDILHATPGTCEGLASYLPVPEGATKLPAVLSSWAFDDDPKPYVIERGPSRLTVRKVRQEHRLLLVFSEENGAAETERLAKFRLTPRELEALRWIAEGKSNAEIAIILGISVSTAKQHVERILAKLGVENRTAAALMMRDNEG
jgi:DNA-binding CsgD family transcriptional regulator